MQALKKLSTKTKMLGVLIVIAFVLYMLGIKFLLLPALIALNVAYLPLPAIFRSVFARVVVGLLISLSLLQVAATLQFFAFPDSKFEVLALLTTLLHVGLLALVPRQKEFKRIWWDRTDLGGVVVMLFFLLPFTAIFIGSGSVAKIAEIGGLQAIDATNHYAGIAEMVDAQHFNYEPGYYYPRGFHVSAAFVQNSFVNNQAELGWRGNAFLYFAHYALLGSLLAYLLYYFCKSLVSRLGTRLEKRGLSGDVFVALALAPPLALFYIIPFVLQGFLNFYYIAAVVAAGFVFLLALTEKNESKLGFVDDATKRWFLLAYLLLIYGVSASWPLLIPPLVLVGALVLLPPGLHPRDAVKSIFNSKNIAIIAAFLLQLVPIYFQIAYMVDGPNQGFNATGGLKEFHLFIVLLGTVLLSALVLSRRVDEAAKRSLLILFIPMFGFVAALALLQYFTAGEIRYYTIKTSLLLEILIMALLAAAAVWLYATNGLLRLKYILLVVFVPFACVLLLLGATGNPLKDSRELFRAYSYVQKPLYYDQDASNYIELGSSGQIKDFNSTVLHYDEVKQKFYAHMQLPFWANMMQYDATRGDFEALHCVGALYSNLAFGLYSSPEQTFLITRAKECAQAARDKGEKFYIITDEASALHIRQTFGDLAEVVY